MVVLFSNKVHLIQKDLDKLKELKAPKGARPQGVPRRGAYLNKILLFVL